MKVKYDWLSGCYTVTLNRKELHKAFENYQQFQQLLHDICKNVYGEKIADKLFPIGDKE